MAFDDSFREREVIEADDVYEICGIRKPAEIYNLVGLGDHLTDWKNRAEKMGATIIPRQVYLTQMYEQYDHRVAWVYHSQAHDDEVEDFHHIVCDCVATMENPDEELEDIAQCPAVLAALEYRAARVSKVLRTQEILNFYGKPEGTVDPKAHTVRTIKSLVNFVMNYEKEHPEGWVANTVSGEHQVPLLATVLQIRPYADQERPEQVSLQTVVEEMHYDGSLVLHDDGTTISLPIAA